MADFSDFPSDDGTQPQSTPPVAVVRRRGENSEQLGLRKMGYSDAQTGYDGTGRQSLGGISPLDRSYRIARQAEIDRQRADAADERAEMAARQVAVREKTFELQLLQKDILNQDTLRAKHDANEFLKASRDLDPADPDFDGKVVDLQVAFPMAAKDEFVVRRMNHLTERRQVESKTQEEAAKFRRAQELAGSSGLQVDRVAEGGVTFAKPPKPDEAKVTVTDSEESASDDPSVTIRTHRTSTTGPASTLPAKAPQADTFEAFQRELKEMVNSYGGKDKVPARRWAEFEQRKNNIGRPAPAPGKAPIAAPAARDFLNGLGITPKLPKLKTVQGTVEG